MKCPHCGIGISWQPEIHYLAHYTQGEKESTNPPIHPVGSSVAWETESEMCPECDEPIFLLVRGDAEEDYSREVIGVDRSKPHERYMVWPRAGARSCPPEVPHKLREDFEEASEVLDISSKASAALSRRCLQHLLQDYAGAKSKNLVDQIDEVVKQNVLSDDLSSQLDAVRNIGNFAAHPLKSTASGEIVPVEPHEAEWTLNILEELFEHYFVKPSRLSKRKEELNRKLVAAGKTPMP